MRLIKAVANPLKSIIPAIEQMVEDGFLEADCIKGTGIELEDLDQHLDIKQEYRFYNKIINLNQNPMFGFEVGKRYDVFSYGLLGYMLMSSRHLKHAVSNTIEYAELTFTPYQLLSGEDEQGFYIQFLPPDDSFDKKLERFYSLRELSACQRAYEQVSSTSRLFSKIITPNLLKPYQKKLATYFKCPIETRPDQKSIVMYFDQDILLKEFKFSDTLVASQCKVYCNELMDRLNSTDNLIQVIQRKILNQPSSVPKMDQMAEEFAITSRTLRRKLLASGTTYQKIVLDIKMELAKDYLLATNLNLTQIAILLGYSSSTNFSQAFKNQNGKSPMHFRKANIK